MGIAATRAPLGRKAAFVVGLTAAATLVLFRFPSAVASVTLAAISGLVAALLWQAWPPSRRRRAPGTTVEPTHDDRPLVAGRS